MGIQSVSSLTVQSLALVPPTSHGQLITVPPIPGMVNLLAWQQQNINTAHGVVNTHCHTLVCVSPGIDQEWWITSSD